LVQAVDDGSSNLQNIQLIVAADPALAGALLRTANSALYSGREPVSTLGAAVMRVGMGAVKTLALSFAIQAAISKPNRPTHFDSRAFSRHGLCSGIAAQHLVKMGASRAVTPDEAFAAGVLHDVPVALLARVAPSAFDLAWEKAKVTEDTFRTVFEAEFNIPLGELGATAGKAWRLPPLLVKALEMQGEVGELMNWASDAADSCGYPFEPWLPETPAEDDVQECLSWITMTAKSLLEGVFASAA
jgi:HD-like signal output (HDOD) protein